MADFINIPFDLNSVAQLAAENAASFWINIVISLIISTVVGGVLLIVVLGLFNRVYGEMLDYKRAFLVVLIINVINYVGVVGLLSGVLGPIPLIGIILPVLIWIIMLKVFFEDMSFLHAIIVGAVFYVITLVAIPYLVSMITTAVGF